MKKLTYSAMAAARLRANKRQYLSLVLGIFLSIFMVSTLVFSAYGIYQAYLQKRYDKVGHLDLVVLDNDYCGDAELLALGDYEELGHAYLSGVVTDRNLYLGYYDETGAELLDLTPVQGRMPGNSGEIAIEASVMEVLEVDWSLGQTVELSVTPVDGVEEQRQFTLVGILPERSAYLDMVDHDGLNQFPAIVTSALEPSFNTGRIGVHYLLGLKENASLGDALERIWTQCLAKGHYFGMYGLSISGSQTQFWGLGEAMYVDDEMFALIFMAVALAAALILSCGIGISGAMEGVLSKRREEIGVLRALGATRRQIRRMFGRENLLLALTASPLSLVVSLGAFWLLSALMGESMKFALNLWLILPIGIFSMIVILISGYLPLVRASRLMPMSVIRDTAMLRRSKRIKSKKSFSAEKLIASRQVRFHPTRQIGSALLVGLMLLCSGLLTSALYSYRTYTAIDPAAFTILSSKGVLPGNYVQSYDSEPISRQSIQQIKGLDHVKSLKIYREMPILATLDQVPSYAAIELWAQTGMLDEAGYQEMVAINGDEGDLSREDYEMDRKYYLQILKDYQLEGNIFQMSIITVDMNSENMRTLKEHLTEGNINLDAINSGDQVLVYAPNVWMSKQDYGGIMYWDQEESVENSPYQDDAKLVAWNDSFSAGQTLPLTQLYSTDGGGTVIRQDAQVQVCGVVDCLGDLSNVSFGYCAIITTEEGLEQMGLRVEGISQIVIFLDGEISLEEEELLERQITAIARRSDGYSVHNELEYYREAEQADRQQLIVFVSIVVMFFAVAVGMIVSSVTRQLHSEGRTIGMLRAVGADERAVLGCYSGQLNAAVFGGFGLAAAMILGFAGFYAVNVMIYGYRVWSAEVTKQILVLLAAALVMAGLCYMVCRAILRLRIREIVSRSIIDNIREL